MSSRLDKPTINGGDAAPGLTAGSPVGTGGEVDADSCDLQIDADLEGIRPDGIKGLNVGDELQVVIMPEAHFKSIVCVRSEGQIVGALSAFTSLTRLMRCLEKGVDYQVLVTEVGKASCHVRGERRPT